MKQHIHVSFGYECESGESAPDMVLHVLSASGEVLAELTPENAAACVELPATGLCIVDVNDPGAYKSPE